MEYHRTKDILHIMQVLGHRRIQNTLKYTQLVKFEGPEAYVCKVATADKEISKLVEAGFEFVFEKDDPKFFRKPK